jgi:hypothetical protein
MPAARNAFFVRCERHDDIAVGLEALSPVTNQARDPNRSLRLVVAGAAPIKETIALNQLKRVHAPIFALGFHNIGVGEKQERLAAASSVITDHEIRLVWICSAHKDVRVGKSSSS